MARTRSQPNGTWGHCTHRVFLVLTIREAVTQYNKWNETVVRPKVESLTKDVMTLGVLYR